MRVALATTRVDLATVAVSGGAVAYRPSRVGPLPV
jgi:hypothetical protein